MGTDQRHSANGLDDQFHAAAGSAALLVLVSLGKRTGLFDTLAQLPPSTIDEISHHTTIQDDALRGWLRGMVEADLVHFNQATKRYSLPAASASILARSTDGNSPARLANLMTGLAAIANDLSEAVEQGRGVPAGLSRRLEEVLTQNWIDGNPTAIESQLLAEIPLLEDRLRMGVQVAVIDCGKGDLLLRLAETFPNSFFTGVDFSLEAIAEARGNAEKKGLKNLRLILEDPAKWRPRGIFDVVFALAAANRARYSEALLTRVRRALRADGIFAIQAIARRPIGHSGRHDVSTLLHSTAICLTGLCESASSAGSRADRPAEAISISEALYRAGFATVAECTAADVGLYDYWVARAA